VKPTPDQVREQFGIQTKDVMELRVLKKAAIKEYRYDLSEGIQVLIDESDSDVSGSFLSELTAWLIEHVSETISRLDTNTRLLNERRRVRESDICSDVEQVREATEARHIEEITLIEVHRTAELMAAGTRETFEYRHALKHSQILAAHDEVDAAIRMKNSADAEIAAVRQGWANEINERYNRKIALTAKRQIRELEEIQRNYDANLELVRASFENEVLTEKRKARVWIQRTMQKAISNPNLEIHKPGLRKQLTDELTKKLHEFLKEREQESLLQLE
jgi:hypothetical protein